MNASINPITGKYYGTEVCIHDGPGRGHSIKLWFASGEPSERMINSWGYTQSQWDNNIAVDDGWGGILPIKSCDLMCDSHYECVETYRVAQAIVMALEHIDD